MEYFWTSNQPISGLRHFVLVNETKEMDQIMFLLVSVLDVEINLRITYDDLYNNGKWEKGWLNLPRIESITKGYLEYKSINKENEGINKIFINDDSFFNIS